MALTLKKDDTINSFLHRLSDVPIHLPIENSVTKKGSGYTKRTKAAQRVVLECKTVDILADVLEFCNKRILENFQLRLEME